MTAYVDVEVEVKLTAEVKIYDVTVDGVDLEFSVRKDTDGDIRIEVNEESFLMVAKDCYGLVEANYGQ
jgi:hypothetical protein